jgi:acetoin utilization protein AcuB
MTEHYQAHPSSFNRHPFREETMLVKDYMTRHPIMIEEHARVIEAQQIMTKNNIRHLPVVGDGKRLIGLVTRQRLMLPPETLASLDVWEIARHLSDMTAGKVMIKGADLKTITPEATLEEAAELMIRHKVGGLPVLEDGGVVCGIITETDLLVELQNLLGAQDAGYRVVVRVPDRMGEFRKLVRVISDKGWGIMAMGSVRSPKIPDKWDIVLKVRHTTKGDLLLALREIPDQEVIDIRETGGA